MSLLRDKNKRSALRSNLYQQLETNGVSLAETVKTLRKVLAKDQNEFSEATGVSLSTLRKIEQEGGSVSLATAQRILDKFGLELIVKTKRR